MSAKDNSLRGRRVATIRETVAMPEYRHAFTEPALRHYIFESKPRRDSRGRILPTNGLLEAGAIIRLNRKVLIDLDRFDAWLASHRMSAQERGLLPRHRSS